MMSSPSPCTGLDLSDADLAAQAGVSTEDIASLKSGVIDDKILRRRGAAFLRQQLQKSMPARMCQRKKDLVSIQRWNHGSTETQVRSISHDGGGKELGIYFATPTVDG